MSITAFVTALRTLISFSFVIFAAQTNAQTKWKKHIIMEQGHCNSALAIDVNKDGKQDVIASFNGKVSLFIAPDWKQEILLDQFEVLMSNS